VWCEQKNGLPDLQALESELNIPIWEDRSKRGISQGYFLPPINFSVEEFGLIFLSMRTMYNMIPHSDPEIISAYFKLNTIAPPFLKKQIINTLERYEEFPKYPKTINNIKLLIEAWVTHHKIRILYRETGEEKPVERIIDPYF
jgi:predicted DNA-binding transcriptional regulator YafY